MAVGRTLRKSISPSSPLVVWLGLSPAENRLTAGQPADGRPRKKVRDNNRGMWYGSGWTEAVPGLSRCSDRVVPLESHRPPAAPCRSERTGGV